jgi:hypothetical protein
VAIVLQVDPFTSGVGGDQDPHRLGAARRTREI